MLAAIAVPEQLATAKLAGFPPESGLYAFAAGTIAFVIFGANRYLSAGGDSTIAPIFAGSLVLLAAAGSPEYLALAGVVALGAGLLLVAAGIAKAGWIADLLSVPVTTGFLAGIAVHIIIGQLPSLLGVAAPGGNLIVRLVTILGRLGEANGYAFALGAAVFAVTFACSRISERIPGALIGLAAAGCAVAAFGLRAHGVAVIGALDGAVPQPRLPHFRDLDQLASLASLAFVVAAVCMMQISAVVRSFPNVQGASEDVSPDFAAIGAGSIVAAIFGAFAVNASPPRTAVFSQSGGRTQLGGLAAVGAIAVLLLFFSQLGAYVPEAALAGVLIFVALRILRVGDMRKIARYSRREFNLMAACAILVVVLPIQQGMLLAIILSLVHGISLVMRPPATQLVHLPGSSVWWPPEPGGHGEEIPGVVVFAVGAPVNFTNAEFIRKKLLDTVAAEQTQVRLVVIEASAMLDVDYTGSQTLQAAIADLKGKGIVVSLARLSGPHAQEAAARSGLIASLGAEHVFLTVADAVAAWTRSGVTRGV